MARKAPPRNPDGPDRIVDIDVDAEMRTSFLEYAYSVIYARALPDARDGLKPVQRRILFQMGQMGLRPDRGHVKSARVVGEVMGRLHPHGDSAIYDALVRLAQPFTLRLPFVDGHGNFGSADDGPAAMRYTECRMAPSAMSMIADIDEDVVDFVANYDGREQEPAVLPAEIPSLLVNGAAGIAVGMATSIPPHNLGEILAACRHLVLTGDVSDDELVKFVPGPDFPGGGTIIGLEGVREGYLTGRGTFRVRGTARIEQVSPRKRGIVVTELPPGVGPERLIERIKDLVSAKKLVGISDVVDLTDGDSGLRLIIEVKSTVNPEAVLTELYTSTPLEDSGSFNCVALVDGEPRTLTLRESLTVFVDHRIQVVRRRSHFRRERARERLHLVEGLLTAIVDIDEVIGVIRSSDDTAAAKERLIAVFDLSEVQAQYILEMPLRRLTKFSRIELESERDDLNSRIDTLTALLDDDTQLRQMVADEMRDTADAHATPRRTILLESTGATATSSAPLEIEDEPCRVLLSSTGLIARTSSLMFEPGTDRSSHDLVVASCSTTTRSALAVITSRGRAVRLEAVEVPGLPPSSQQPSLAGGAPLGAVVTLAAGEKPIALAPISTSVPLFLATARGVVKRTLLDPPSTKTDWELIPLRDGDEVVGAALAPDDANIVLVTSTSQALMYPASAIRAQGRSAAGMTGVKLTDGTVIYANAVPADTEQAIIATIAGSTSHLPGTTSGSLKVTDLSEIPAKGRGTQGVRVHRFLKGEDVLIGAYAGPGPLRAASASGIPVDLPDARGRRDGSGEALSASAATIGGPVT